MNLLLSPIAAVGGHAKFAALRATRRKANTRSTLDTMLGRYLIEASPLKRTFKKRPRLAVREEGKSQLATVISNLDL